MGEQSGADQAGAAQAGAGADRAAAIVRAHAKLTRTLRVVGRRADGYHLLESEMVTLELADELEIAPLDAGGPGGTPPPSRLEVLDEVRWCGEARPQAAVAPPAAGGPTAIAPAAGVPAGGDNLVIRALDAVGRRAEVRLRKRIPAGAGLGGGSADAAAVLRWAGVTESGVALRLGADVPFCLVGGRAMVRGVGEEVEPLEPLAASFLLCTPPAGVSTVAAYRAFDELGPGAPEPERRNDLEHAALAVFPALALWRDLLLQVTGHRPQLAGSGSTWFVELAPGVATGHAAERLLAELAAAVRVAGARAAVAVARTVGTDGEPVPTTGGLD